jgi:RNA polymerase sigma-70 factor (ECF subfamily)
VAVDAPDPQRACELAESYTLLLQALDELSAPLRATVVLVAVSGLSHREAAKVQDTNEGTIAWRMHEARRQLRAQLSPSTSGVRSRGNAVARSEEEPERRGTRWPSRTRQRSPGRGPAV